VDSGGVLDPLGAVFDLIIVKMATFKLSGAQLRRSAVAELIRKQQGVAVAGEEEASARVAVWNGKVPRRARSGAVRCLMGR
jgi:hypothetical protein